MSTLTSVEPAIDPNNRITFLLDWELTMKCNLNCDYCPPGLHGGHDNSTAHPPVEQCLKTIDFMFEYVDLYMATKPQGIKYVVLNVYGGESLHHPDIVTVLETVRERYRHYQSRWGLTITTTTNAIVSEAKLEKIIPLIDEFTVSYHTANTVKQKQEFKRNLLTIKQAGRRLKCVVLMHSEPDLFADAQGMIQWLADNNIKDLPRQLDRNPQGNKFNHESQQIQWFENLYNKKSYNSTVSLPVESATTNLTNVGRACCGGRQLCADQDYKSRKFFIQNEFRNWYCSVNHFFLYIKQVNGEIYVNKDCKMNFAGDVAPIGTLDQSDQLLSWTREHLSAKTLPVIQCKKDKCMCGLCAPKAQNLDIYNKTMKKYQSKT